jgi:hypothetical protein
MSTSRHVTPQVSTPFDSRTWCSLYLDPHQPRINLTPTTPTRNRSFWPTTLAISFARCPFQNDAQAVSSC